MTRSDYERLAKVFYEARNAPGITDAERHGIDFAARCMANMLAEQTPAFSRARFLNNAGVLASVTTTGLKP